MQSTPSISRILIFLFMIGIPFATMAQSKPGGAQLPYYQIPEYPEEYSATTVAARMIDGLGFRYYWATEGLIDQDLQYKPSEEARTIRQTLEHIFGLSNVIKNATINKANEGLEISEWSFDELRKRTLENIAFASQTMKDINPENIDELHLIFSTNEFPFWNLLNGPLADAIYHVGQVVSFRRASGNPISNKPRMLTGKAME